MAAAHEGHHHDTLTPHEKDMVAALKAEFWPQVKVGAQHR